MFFLFLRREHDPTFSLLSTHVDLSLCGKLDQVIAPEPLTTASALKLEAYWTEHRETAQPGPKCIEQSFHWSSPRLSTFFGTTFKSVQTKLIPSYCFGLRRVHSRNNPSYPSECNEMSARFPGRKTMDMKLASLRLPIIIETRRATCAYSPGQEVSGIRD